MPHVLDHQLGGGRVGELGEDHDQAASLQAPEQVVHSEHVVGLLRRRVERGQRATNPP